MGTLLHSCVEVSELIKLLFGVVSVVDSGIDVLVGSTCCKGGGFREVPWSFSPIRFNGTLLSRTVLDSCVKS